MTDAGHGEAVVGQDRDSDTLDVTVEELLAIARENLEKDLRLVIHAGYSLNASHCGRLSIMPYLERTLAAAMDRLGPRSTDTNEMGALYHPPTPLAVRNAVLGSIERLRAASIGQLTMPTSNMSITTELDDPEEAEAYFEVRMLLFGFAPATKRKGPTERWKNALDYYNKELNDRKRKITAKVDNFRKRICSRELLAPLFATLFNYEVELRNQQQRTLAAVSASLTRVTRHWRDGYWWLFRLAGLLESVWWNAEYYLRVKKNLPFDNMIPFPADPPRGDAFDERAARIHLQYSLYSTAVVWRFIRYEGWPARWYDPEEFSGIHTMPKYQLSDILTDFQIDFSFSASDQAWLDLVLDSAPSDQRWGSANGDEGVDTGYGEALIDRLDSDKTGQVVLARFTALVDACECLTKEIAPEERCVFHKLRDRTKLLTDMIQLGWCRLARLDTEFHDIGAIPALDVNIDRP